MFKYVFNLCELCYRMCFLKREHKSCREAYNQGRWRGVVDAVGKFATGQSKVDILLWAISEVFEETEPKK